MFLDMLIKRNPELIKTAASLHQEGKIPSNSYVLDIDTIGSNTKILKATGDRLGIKVFPMTKQLGRNPAVIRKMRDCGIEACVAVDMMDARGVFEAGLKIGHLGHLVQVPGGESEAASIMNPMYWTVYSRKKAVEAANAARKTGRQQNILARVYAEGDRFYTGHEGGFKSEDIVETAKFIDSLEGAKFAGITTFPTLLYHEDCGIIKPTPNLSTLERVAQKLQEAGYKDLEINCPGTTGSEVMPMLAKAGATQVEPGNGLTGTTPLHAKKELAELPSILYLSEVSHFYNNQAYCFGGGMYIDPVFPDYDVYALVGNNQNTIMDTKLQCSMPTPNTIDYYGRLQMGENKIKTGDTVIFGFRCQAFVTRAYVTAVGGIASGTPYIEGIYDVYGQRVRWPM